VSKALRIIAIVYAVAGIIAVLMVPASVYGWAGVEPDPLSGVFALLLGLPWSLTLELLGEPNTWKSLAVCAVGIAINAWLLFWLARRTAA
jgi:hypothetical protein